MSSSDSKTPYEEFLLAEYNNIAGAHFNTVNTIATFFKHYLLIVSLPLPAVGIFISKNPVNPITTIVKCLSPVIALTLSLVGLFVLAYISNLWLDQLLYARTVNGIRSYFTRNAQISLHDSLGVRVLPISVNVPKYSGNFYFSWVAISFSLINSLYFAAGIYLLAKYWVLFNEWPLLSYMEHFYIYLKSVIHILDIRWITVISFILYMGINKLLYYLLCKFREGSYLKSKVIGIDIDGVLGDHRKQFINSLKKYKDCNIDPDLITRIPVHKCEGLGISREEEALVFNDPEYWKSMPVREGAVETLKKLKKIYPSYKIHLFTSRDWPSYERLSKNDRDSLKIKWKISIKKITKKWLKQNDLIFDKLTIETTRPNRITRFSLSDFGSIRVFIEDDAENAIRLASMCDIVILLDEPYNRHIKGENLPPNIIRFSSWDDILCELKYL